MLESTSPAVQDRGRLLSTGIDPLDARIEGLLPGRYYVLSGAPGAGKTSAALHFIGAGLDEGETCAILTQEDPTDLLVQANFLGYDFQSAADAERLTLLRYRLDFHRSYSRAPDPDVVFEELKAHLWENMPRRFVIDSLLPLLEGGLTADDAVEAFARFLEGIPPTTYLTVPGDLNDTYYRRIYNRITAGSAGIFHFEMASGNVRELSVRKLRHASAVEQPLNFVIRPGAGIVEDIHLRSHDDLPEEFRRRVILLNWSGGFPEEWIPALRGAYDLSRYDSIERAFADLASATYGALLVTIDPIDPEPALRLTRELRKAGNGAPILFVSPTRGLRGQTRAQGLRAGGDDFLTDVLAPDELLARIDNARARGHRRATLSAVAASPPSRQPEDDSGAPLLMPADHFRRVLLQHVRDSENAFFALVAIAPGVLDSSEAWQFLHRRLRVRDGDLIAQMEDGRLAAYLHDIQRRHVEELLERLQKEKPGLMNLSESVVLCHPADGEAIYAWLGGTDQAGGDIRDRVRLDVPAPAS